MEKKNVYRITMMDYNQALFQAKDMMELMDHFYKTGDIHIANIRTIDLVEED